MAVEMSHTRPGMCHTLSDIINSTIREISRYSYDCDDVVIIVVEREGGIYPVSIYCS